MKQMRKIARIYGEGGLAGIAQSAVRKFSKRPEDPRSTIPPAWTEYIEWLTYANAGMLDRGNVDCFDYAIAHLPSNAPMLEIGSFCGLSTNVLTYLKDKRSARNPLITCDRWIFECATPGEMLGDSKTIPRSEYREFVKETFIRNIRMFSRDDLPYTVELFSDEFFTAWEGNENRRDVFGRDVKLGGPISFCYIDGNHSYDFAKRDFLNVNRYLEPGGFVLFDDSADGTEWEVCRVVQEVLSLPEYRLVARSPNYFFQKR